MAYNKEYVSKLKATVYFADTPDIKYVVGGNKSKICEVFNSQYQKRLFGIIDKNTNKYSQLSNMLTKEIVSSCANERTDTQIFKNLANIYHKFPKTDQKNEQRSAKRINQLSYYLDKFTGENYLDYGCHTGDLTKAVGEFYNIKNVYGCDIHNNCDPKNNIDFSLLSGDTLPYDNEQFDLITCFMVLHHVPHDKLSKLLSEFCRVLKPNGLLIIREHDLIDPMFGNLLDVLHGFYDYVWKPNVSWEQDIEFCDTFYHSAEDWDKLFAESGLTLVTKQDNHINPEKNPLNVYHRIYKKEDITME